MLLLAGLLCAAFLYMLMYAVPALLHPANLQTLLFTQPPRGDQADSAHTGKGAGPPHPNSEGRVWPKVLDGIQLTMTEHSLASRR